MKALVKAVSRNYDSYTVSNPHKAVSSIFGSEKKKQQTTDLKEQQITWASRLYSDLINNIIN